MASETRWIWSEPSSSIAQISARRWGAATGDEVAVLVFMVFFLLPLGMEKEDRCEQAAQTWKLEGVPGTINSFDLEC